MRTHVMKLLMEHLAIVIWLCEFQQASQGALKQDPTVALRPPYGADEGALSKFDKRPAYQDRTLSGNDTSSVFSGVRIELGSCLELLDVEHKGARASNRNPNTAYQYEL